MKLCSSPIALILGAVFIILATQDYAVDPNFSVDADSAFGVSELALIGLGLLALRIVRNRSTRRKICSIEPLAISWLACTEARPGNPNLTEI